MSKKGAISERELVHLFWDKGFAAVRVAGSGRMNYPSPDILVGIGDKKLAIECKSNKSGSVYLTQKEIEELRVFSELFKAVPLIGIRSNNKSWFFLNICDLKKTEKNFSVSVNLIKDKGMDFEQLVSLNQKV